ncbi:MAG TPA: DegT/DnrJ/EryC1/StrS family aminotransferase, partial [Verrucomicrobiota bacterium]|nr:DegT/DnrJ/EryC1/StrS family aminotransferase [Verrucomicrobiota bacterium]
MKSNPSERIFLSVPHMSGSERQYVDAAFESNWLSTIGPNLLALEQRLGEMFGQPVALLASGTAGMHLGVRLLGIQPGDEVVTPSLTFAASCNPVLYEGARPVFVDSERTSWNLDPNLLDDFLKRRAAAGRLPKAVTVVHLYGQSADMDSILGICDRYGLPVLEDAAHAMGTRYRGRLAATLGQVGVVSLGGNKVITATSGGLLTARAPELVERARYWSTQARDQDPLGINNYVHSELGYNYRMSNVLAGIALGQLDVLELRVQQRQRVFERYHAAFADLPGIEPQPEGGFGDRRSEIGDRGGGAAACSRLEALGDRRSEIGDGGDGAPACSRLGGDGDRSSEFGVRSSEFGDGEDGASVERGAGSREQGAGGQGGSGGNVQRSTFNAQRSTSNHQPSTIDHQPPTSSLHTRWLSCFLIDKEKFGMSSSDLIRFLDAANIESRPVWKPMHTQPLYRGCECVGGEVAADLNRRGICLPSSSSLSAEDQQFVIERIRQAHKR